MSKNVNPNTLCWRRLDLEYVWHPFTQHSLWNAQPPEDLPLVIVRGEREFVFDSEGRKFIDGHSSLWCNLHGHNHPALNAALQKQAEKIAHSTLLGLTNPPAAELAERLIRLARQNGLNRLAKVFYSDDGSTAVEVACKMAFAYWKHTTGHPRELFIAFRSAYHGDTIGSVSVGGIDLFHSAYRPLLFKTLFAPSPTENAALQKLAQILHEHAGEVAGVVIEPLVQCAGGILVAPAGFLGDVAELCRKHDVLFIADEVATGFGRTGQMFACTHEGVCPDLFCVSKGLTSGYLPLGATLVTRNIYDAFLGPIDSGRTLYHGHTFTGNPLGCAVALASLDVFEKEHVLERIQPRIRQLADGLARLSNLPHVGSVRQCGLIAGVELVADKTTGRPFPYREQIGAQICRAMLQHGVILRPLADTVVIFPPLCISEESLQRILVGLEAAIGEVLDGKPQGVDGLE